MPDTPPSFPEGWDFDPAFLDNPDHLPPFVPSHGSALFGTARRLAKEDVEHFLPLTVPDARQLAKTVRLEGVTAIVEDRAQGRNRLHGPAHWVLPEALLNRHWLWVGPPGVGKTTQAVLPFVQALLADAGRSLVVFDPKGDQYGVIRDLAVEAGRSARSVVRLNLTDRRGSIGWNPLRAGLSRTEALNIATTLVMASESKGSNESPFWRNTSIELIVDILLGLDRDPEERLTLPRVLEVVSQPRRDLLAWLREHGAHKFAAFLESGSHNAETCLCDTGMRLVPLLDLDLCAVLSHGELDLDRLFAKPTVLVVEMNETRLESLRPMFNLMVQQILDRAIEAAERTPTSELRVPLSVVIDEFGSAIGAIPRFPVYLNTLRSRRISIVCAVQGVSQLQSLYGNDAGALLAGFSSKMFFAGVDHPDAEYASLCSGTMTVAAPQPGGDAQLLGRRVFLPEEIARPRAHPVLGRPVTMLLAEFPAFQAYLTPSFRLPRFRAALAMQRRRRSRPRRSAPLRYEPPALAQQQPFTDVRFLTPVQLAARLQIAERAIDLDAATAGARELWLAWRRRKPMSSGAMLRLAEELIRRGAKLDDFHRAYIESRCGDTRVVLIYLDYLLARRKHDADRRDVS